MREYKYMELDAIEEFEDEMKEKEVSLVARSSRGFLTAYKRVEGDSNKLSDFWRTKRFGFIRRHMAQYKKNPTRRRKLALIAWAYMP